MNIHEKVIRNVYRTSILIIVLEKKISHTYI